MSARIVWISVAAKLFLQGTPHQILVEHPADLVAQVEDGPVLNLLRADTSARILYWRRDGWDRAVLSLSAGDVDDVIERRRQTYNARAVRNGELEATLRTCVGSAAYAHGFRPAAQLQVYIQHLLDELGAEPWTSLSGSEAFDLYVRAKEQARTQAEEALSALGSEGGRFGEVVDSISKDFEAVNQAASRGGQPDLRNTRLHLEREHVYFVRPLQPEIEKAARRRHDSVLRWDGGGLVAWPTRELDVFGTRKIVILDVDPGFLGSARIDLTHAQLDRDVNRRLVSPPGRTAWLEFVDQLWIRAAIQARRLAATLRAKDRESAAEIDRANAAEIPRLLAVWSRGNGLAPAPTDARNARDLLFACHAQAMADAAFVAGLDVLEAKPTAAAKSRLLYDRLASFGKELRGGSP